MSFTPVLPQTGLLGWSFLQRTAETQKEVLSNTGLLKREVDYFRENIGDIKTAEALVADRTLLKVALGAFGLQDDIDNKFFITKVLSDGTTDDDALSNKLADKSYLAFSQAFGFGPEEVGEVSTPGGIEEIIALYEDRSFEVAVGEQDSTLRLALSLERDLGAIASSSASNDTKWFNILGNAPLREVFETTFQLPDAFATIDLDKQLETLKERATSFFGSDEVSQFAESDQLETLTTRFLLSSQLTGNSGVGSGSIALTLLQNSVLRF